jgi:hypothetical protein
MPNEMHISNCWAVAGSGPYQGLYPFFAPIVLSRNVHTHRMFRIFVVVLLVSAVAMAIPPIRTSVLRSAGWTLVVYPDAVQSGDIIVVAVDADGAGTLQAADLVHAGVATKVAVFADPPDTVDNEFIRRGIPYHNVAAISTSQLRALGVATVEQIPRTVGGSEDEGTVLPGWCDQNKYRSIVLVTSADHSRRLRRILHRSMKGRHTTVTVVPSRYSSFNPDRWWETRSGIRLEIVELEKLVIDLARHPIS